MLSLAWIIVAVFTVAVTGELSYQEQLVSAIKEKSGDALLWEPGTNFEIDAPKDFFDHLIGNYNISSQLAAYKSSSHCDAECPTLGHDDGDKVPENFDARKKWPQCESIGKVPDQGACKADYAISTTGAIADRICIASGGKVKSTISAQQVVSCCKDCGRGCKGGIPQEVWMYLHRRGIASGGDYNSNEGCQPYLKKPIGFTPNKFYTAPAFKTPKCRSVCYNQQYTKAKKPREDLHKGGQPGRMCCCMVAEEVFTKGPVTTSMILYEDFLTYKSGIYHHVSGNRLGHISVKVIGYGVENKQPYWLAINNWGNKWGDNGTFKILKKENGVEFENYLFSGEVNV